MKKPSILIRRPVGKPNGSKPPKPKVRVKPIPVNFARLRALKCFKDVHGKLIEGWPTNRIATYIQEERQEYTDVTHDGLVSMLHKYRTTIPAAEMAGKLLNKSQVEALEQVQEDIDEMQEIRRLIYIQRERIDFELALERAMKKTMPTTANEIRLANELVASLAELRMDFGEQERHLGISHHSETRSNINLDLSDPVVQKVMENPESKQKILGIAQKLLQAAGVARLPIKDEREESQMLDLAVYDSEDK